MLSLGEIQFGNLLSEIRHGAIAVPDLRVVESSICVLDGDRLLVRIPCESPDHAYRAIDLLRIKAREAGVCDGC